MSPSLEAFSRSFSTLLMSQFPGLGKLHTESEIDGDILKIEVTYVPKNVLEFVNVEFTVRERGK